MWKQSRIGLARLCGEVRLSGGRFSGRRPSQAGYGMACSRARAPLNWVSQGQRRGRCRVNRRAERVSRPARAKKRRLRVLVVATGSPRPMRAVHRARLLGHHLNRQPGSVGGEASLVLQRQFTEGCSETPGGRRGVWRESGWPDGCATAPPPATAATPQHPTVPGAASPAPPGRLGAC